MNKNNESDAFSIEELPVSIRVTVERGERYGTVPDLEEEAPCDVDELERMTLWDLYGPVLELRLHGRRGRLSASDGVMDWNACGVVDCEKRWRSVLEGRRATNGPPRVPVHPEHEGALRAYIRQGVLAPEHICDPHLRARVTAQARSG